MWLLSAQLMDEPSAADINARDECIWHCFMHMAISIRFFNAGLEPFWMLLTSSCCFDLPELAFQRRIVFSVTCIEKNIYLTSKDCNNHHKYHYEVKRVKRA